jgi:hypothetical protein
MQPMPRREVCFEGNLSHREASRYLRQGPQEILYLRFQCVKTFLNSFQE